MRVHLSFLQNSGTSPCQRNKIPRVFLLLLHQFSTVEDPRQMHIYLTENSVTPLTTWSHNFLHYSAIISSSLIHGPSPNFQHISLWIFSHGKSFHSQPQFSRVHHKIQFSRILLLHETTFKGILHMQPYIPWFIHGNL